jgi:hypothetical protein
MKLNPKYRHEIYSLYKCLYHWEYLAKTGTSDKTKYFAQMDTMYSKSYLYPDCDCFCCENARYWNKSRMNRNCKVCSLNGYAWKEAEESRSTPCNVFCNEYEDEDINIGDIPFSSLYDYWCEATAEENSRMASRMVRVIKEAIFDMELKRLRRR